MKITNIGEKVIGFGSEFVLPGETKPLSAGFDENHPVVKFYIASKFITVVNDNVSVPVKEETDEEESDEKSTSVENKPLSRMNKEELQTLAAGLGVEVDATDSNDILREKIKAAQKGDE